MNTQESRIRLLLITGTEAYKEFQAIDWGAVQNRFELEIHLIKISTIAFLTIKQLEIELNQLSDINFDYILVSGLIPWDVSIIESPLAPKVKKGTKFIGMLPEILLNFDVHKLSSKVAADTLYHNKIQQNIENFIQNARNQYHNTEDPNGFILSKSHPELIFSTHLPPIIIVEIVDAPLFSFEELCVKLEYLQRQGADIIDIGCIVNQDNSVFLSKTISQLKSKYSIPFSIDSIDSAEIHAAVQSGAEMVISVNPDNIDNLLDLPRDLPLVLIPVSFTNNHGTLSPTDRVNILMELGSKLSENGFEKILLDPLIDAPIHPGILPSIEALSLLHDGIKNLPDRDEEGKLLHKPHLLMGACNITELIDADSSGINALIAVLTAELGISAILTNEYSNKSRKSVEELKTALLLTYYAKQQNIPPINCGFSALRLKSKQKYPSYRNFGEPQTIVEPISKPADMDPFGYFKISIDLDHNQIFVTHFTNTTDKSNATRTFIGTTAESLYKQIFEENLVSRLDHAAYLGKELMKAEQALKYGTEYVES